MTGGQWVHFVADGVVALMAGIGAGGALSQHRANARLLKVLDVRALDLGDMAAVCSKLDPELLPRLIERARLLSEELRR